MLIEQRDDSDHLNSASRTVFRAAQNGPRNCGVFLGCRITIDGPIRRVIAAHLAGRPSEKSLLKRLINSLGFANDVIAPNWAARGRRENGLLKMHGKSYHLVSQEPLERIQNAVGLDVKGDTGSPAALVGKQSGASSHASGEECHSFELLLAEIV